MRLQAFQYSLVSALLWATVGSAWGTTIVFDNFDDMDLRDGDPHTWNFGEDYPVYGADADVSSGDLAFTSGESPRAVSYGEPLAGDVSIRSQFRAASGIVGLATKVQPEGSPTGVNGYFFQIEPAGNLLAIARVNGVESPIASVPVTPAVGTDRDVVLQMDVVGDTIFGRYWEAGTVPPAAPQLSLQLAETLEAGDAGVFVYDNGDAVFRYIQIADAPIPVPEPGSMLLMMCAGVWGCMLKRRLR